MAIVLSPACVLLIAAALLAYALRWRASGWGALVWLACFVAMFAIRTPHSIRNRANVIVGARKGLDERLLLSGMFITMMVLPLLQLATGAFGFADYRLPSWATWTGALLQLPCLWLFWRSHADLGRNWSPGLEVRQEHQLITAGVYRRIRHPMYAAIWIAALTQPLLIHNWIAGALVIPAFAAMWLIRVPSEEAMMRAEFGSAYDDYCLRAGRLLPR
ncbi:protein-S-isoprenylcysteine O-methyltransferase [Bordetella holmesii]|uniref:protein-S-isoprenylcysteine O-methyltransferase n=1 Tax=Bordetella holmesii TaxID=35814 RepID=UPI001EEEB795|nr:protein-S-isoprenylcysteine O-methyltransferase [Bordetella holmesii]